jgi:hypothetical protein
MLDTFIGSIPGESLSKEFGSLPTDKPPVTANPEQAFEAISRTLNNKNSFIF